MLYRDRLSDDYENHQRRCAYRTDGLEDLTRETPVQTRNWYRGIVSRLADGLIAAGNSLKQDEAEARPATLSPIPR